MLDLPLQLDPDGPPLYRQIAVQVMEFVRAGRLARGAKLPPTRALAVALGVHRNTVIAAYEELQAQGYTDAGPGRGTFVARQLPEDPFRTPVATSATVPATTAAGAAAPATTAAAPAARNRASRLLSAPFPAATAAAPASTAAAAPAGGALLRAEKRFSRLAQHLPGVMNHDSLLAARRAARTNLNSGAFALDLFPWETFRGVLSDVLGRHWRRLTEGDHPMGLQSLREALAALLFTHGVAADAGEIVITTGSQQAIDLLARLYLDPGDGVAVEDPGYQAAPQRFALEGARIEPIPVDDAGMNLDALRAVLRRRPLKLLFLTPNCHWPTGAQLSGSRRAELAELVERHDLLVIEDDYAAELRFRGPASVPLYMSLPPGRCLSLGSFSKSLLPGLRLGYAVAPAEIARRLSALKLLTDSHSSLLVQAAVAEFIQRGHFETHLRKLRRECRLRLEALSAALRQTLNGRLAWREPDAGSNLWCALTIAGPANAVDFAAYCGEQGLVFTPAGQYYARPEDGARQLLLGFAGIPVPRAQATAEQLRTCLDGYERSLARAAAATAPARAPRSRRTRGPSRQPSRQLDAADLR